MFRHFLVPLDGTPMANRVLPTVRSLAGRAGARVTLLHVLEKNAPARVHDSPHLTGRPEAEAFLKRIRDDCFPGDSNIGWHVHEETVDSVPRGLMAHALELGADLLVVSSHGRERLKHWLIGSMAQRTLDEGLTPVLWLPPSEGERPLFPFRTLLLPLDGDPGHEACLPHAAAMSELSQAAVTLVRVVPTQADLTGSQAGAANYLPLATRALLEITEKKAAEYLRQQRKQFDNKAAGVRALVVWGNPYEEIRDLAGKISADLVVVGTHGRHGLDAFWEGSLASKLLDRVPASFLLVHSPRRE